MADKKGKKGSSISGVGSSKKTTQVQGAQGIDDVDATKKVGKVSKVEKAGGISGDKGTNKMSLAERERLLHLVEDEAKQFFKESGIPKEKQEIIQQAVKMAIDTGLINEEDDG